MSGIASGKNILDATDDDVKKLLACKVHTGTKNCCQDMERYVHSRRKDGVHIIDLHMTWQKIVLAARAIVTIENPADVCVISARPYGQRACLKYSQYTGASYIAGRFTPGNFTNQIQQRFLQPRLLIITDPRTDHQPIQESAYVNIPVIALCDTDSPLQFVDICIPCNNRGKTAIGMLYWMLAREVLRMRGNIPRSVPWDIKVDLFFYRDAEDVMKKGEEEQANTGAQSGYSGTAMKTGSNTITPQDNVDFPAIAGGATASWGDEGWDQPATNWGNE
eukprot:TRINITY_DN54277_c0_g2_i1.p1 TRINITY_DN54277_c0_g2~~TRINITY_DN54277_c0_g2_i1.p1  ORF type:complete len:291 (+),score=50.47 TRINITY_DN54277_c0_g2_i1:44-874(+)